MVDSQKAEDDFFAFSQSEDDFGPDEVGVEVLRKKKEKRDKKKKHSHHKHRHHHQVSTSASKESSGTSFSSAIDLEDDPSVASKSSSRARTSDEDLWEILGTSEKDIEGERKRVQEEERAERERKRQRKLMEKAQADQKRRIEGEEDEFLKQLDMDVEQLNSPEFDAPAASLRRTVKLNGNEVPISVVHFSATLSMSDLVLHMTFKGSASFKKIREAFLAELTKRRGIPPPADAESLVFYIEELDIVAKQVLRVGALLNLSNAKLPFNESGDGYKFHAKLVDEETGQGLRKMRSVHENNERIIDDLAAFDDNEDGSMTLTMRDSITKGETRVAVMNGTQLRDLAGIFLVRMKYPDNLKVKLYQDGEGEAFDLEKTVGEVSLADKDLIEVSYLESDLEALRGSKSDDGTGKGDDVGGNVGDDAANTTIDDANYFTLKLRGKEGEFKVEVNPSTKTSALIGYYRTKSGTSASTLKLLFDGDPLEDGVVGECDAEDGDIIDVV